MRPGASAPHKTPAANRPPIHIVEQKRMKMFEAVPGLCRLMNAKPNGIISL
jgi:hypothetical protein